MLPSPIPRRLSLRSRICARGSGHEREEVVSRPKRGPKASAAPCLAHKRLALVRRGELRRRLMLEHVRVLFEEPLEHVIAAREREEREEREDAHYPSHGDRSNFGSS